MTDPSGYQLSSQLTVRLSQHLSDGIDWFIGQVIADQETRITRPEAARRLLLAALRRVRAVSASTDSVRAQ